MHFVGRKLLDLRDFIPHQAININGYETPGWKYTSLLPQDLTFPDPLSFRLSLPPDKLQ